MLGTFLFLTYFFQGTLHYSALKTGFAFLPSPEGSSSAPGWPADSYPDGPRALMIAGWHWPQAARVVHGTDGPQLVRRPRLAPEILVSLGMGYVRSHEQHGV